MFDRRSNFIWIVLKYDLFTLERQQMREIYEINSKMEFPEKIENTVEPGYNDPRYNDNLYITIAVLGPGSRNIEYVIKNLDITILL